MPEVERLDGSVERVDRGFIARRLNATALAAVGLLLLWLFYWNAWFGDDAFITFRSVEQLLAGNGPRWNPHERVQAFTHPLWLICLAAVRIGIPSLVWGSLLVSFLLTAGAVLCARSFVGRLTQWLVLVALLCSSKAFIDFAWSGLETPLAYFLLGAFCVVVGSDETIGPRPGVDEVTAVAFLVGLLGLTHPDLVLIVLPMLVRISAHSSSPPRRVLRSLAVGLSPAWLWAAFATLYYGTPIPNTAYAKLNTGVPRLELWEQGLFYAVQTFKWDPVTVSTCAVGIALLLRDVRWRLVGVGLLLYVVYVVGIGGDFMVGRLFAPAFFVSALFVARALRRPVHQAVVFTALFAVNVGDSSIPVRLPVHYSVDDSFDHEASHGIADEKAFYFEHRSMRRLLRQPLPPTPLPDGKALVISNIGLPGYAAGLDRILIDELALSDPLLARLPARRDWRPGHFTRDLPDGYLESVREGGNQVRNPEIRALYADVLLLTQGSLVSVERLRAIVRLQFFTRRPECIDPPCELAARSRE